MAEATYSCWRDNLINKPKYFNKKVAAEQPWICGKPRTQVVNKLSGRSKLSILAKTTPTTSMYMWKTKNLHKSSVHNIG
jgi:hypothetical protein